MKNLLQTHYLLDEAIALARQFERILEPDYHVGIAGSTLQKGASNKDIDLIIFPDKAPNLSDQKIDQILKKLKLIEIANPKFEDDLKFVRMCDYHGKRIDLIFME